MRASHIWHTLQEGNRRYSSGLSPDWAVGGGEPPHRPLAVVVACSDARVPAEAVFDQPPGTLFVVRVAGHVLEPAALASVRFAVEVLGAEAVVVLGHTACGAVRAALDADRPRGLEAIVEPIRHRLERRGGCETLDERSAVAANIHETAREVVDYLDGVLSPDVARPPVRPAVCDVATGVVEWL